MKKNLALVLFLYGWACVVSACTKTAEYPAYCYDRDRFRATILLCTNNSKTRDESRACRERTNRGCGFTETLSMNAHE